MKKKDWSYSRRIHFRYQKALRLASRYIQKYVANAETVEQATSLLLEIPHQYWWRDFAVKESLKMVKSIAVENATTWREAAKQGGRSQEIHKLLKQEFQHSQIFQKLVQTNAQKIVSLPSEVARETTKQASRYAISGWRPEALAKKMKEDIPNITEWKAMQIARTEVSKAQEAITQTRSQQLGLDWYVWETSMDQRVRSSHDHMQGVLCNYNNPPSPETLIGQPSTLGHYNAGSAPNCRCYAATLIDPELETWPKKIVINNKIETISKPEFIKRFWKE